MRAEERREIWEGLSTVEDWLAGGIKRERPLPDFAAAEAVAAAAREEAAARSVAAQARTASKRTATRAGGAAAGGGGAAAGGGGAAAGGGGAAAGRGGGAVERGGGEPAGDSLGAAAVHGGAAGMEEIAAEILGCAACGLAAQRRRAVPGQGVPRPLVLVVGEGPGSEEDAQGLPFVGPAGKLLDKMLASIGLSRFENCFIANVVKCRPPMNRDPLPDERDACLGYLRRQIALLEPRAIFCVGRVAATALLGGSEGIGRLRGRWLAFEGTPLLATYHPSALLRDEALKRPAWEDLKLLREFLEAGPPSDG